jgi:outer membrane protein, multidrug efflux system
MTKPTHAATTLAMAGLLGACAGAGVPQGEAALPTNTPPTAWQASAPMLAHGGSTAALSEWWTQFDEPTLPALIQAAQAASPTLASARARIERARSSLATTGALLGPQLFVAGSASHGVSAPKAPEATGASLGLQASWELDLFGAGTAAKAAARARLQGAQAGWHEARVSLAADVATLLLSYRACQAQLEQARIDAQSRAETSRLTELSAQRGFTAPADAALVRAGAAQSRSQALAQAAACDTQLKSLVELTAQPEPELRTLLAAGAGKVPQPAPIATAALPAQLLQQRPDLADAARAVVAAAADSAQADARQRPQISISGSLAAASLRSGGVSTNGSVWSIGPLSVSLPLFDGGALAANSAAAKAGYHEAVAQYQAALRRAVREVEVSLVALDATAERERDALSAARDFEASLVATQARQRGGLASLLDLENARRLAVQANSALIELQRERAAAWVALYRALGGGWQPTDITARTAAKP